MASLKYVSSPTLYLAGSGTIVGATSIVLTSLTDIYGNVLTMSDFGDKGFVTLEPDTSNEEQATFTGITANANLTYTLTGVKSSLAKSAYTETSGLVRQHSGGSKVVVTDTVAFWNTFANKINDEVVTGNWDVPTPTSANKIANKGYVDGVAIAGGADASTTVKGISKLSVAPVSGTNPIAVGDNDTRVPTTSQTASLVGNNTDIAVGSGNKMVTQTGLQHNAEKYAADTSGSSTAYVITLSPVPTSLTAGMEVYAKIVNSNTTTTPTLNVNGLGAKTIVKITSTALAVGDIAANQFCKFMYDGTNFVLQNPVANIIVANLGESTIPLLSGTSTDITNVYFAPTTNTAGNIMVISYGASTGSIKVIRLVKDSITGYWYITHTGSFATVTSVLDTFCTIIAGSYVYVSYRDNSTLKLTRFDLATMLNGTAMTYSGAAPGASGSGAGHTDGTDLYIYNGTVSQFYRYTISGTTATNAATITYTSAGDVRVLGSYCDGTNVWMSNATATGATTVNKYPLAGGASTSNASYIFTWDIYPNYSAIRLFNYASGLMGIAQAYTVASATAITGTVAKLLSVVTP